MLDAIAMHVDSTAVWWDAKRKEGACSFAVKCRFTHLNRCLQSCSLPKKCETVRPIILRVITAVSGWRWIIQTIALYLLLCLSIPNNVRWPEPIPAPGRRCSNTSNSQNWEQKPHLWVLTLFFESHQQVFLENFAAFDFKDLMTLTWSSFRHLS